MCGIACWFDEFGDLRDKVNIIDEMRNSLISRGPDEEGTEVDINIALMHRRLTIIDAENGKQPLSYQLGENKYTIVYNGELYNTDEIRNELLLSGYDFRGYSDTEAVLLSYLHWGEKCLDRLNGIFAFAIYDYNEKSIFFARDRIGVKPLFFYKYDSGIIIASEMKAILKNPIVKPVIDKEGLYELFWLAPGKTQGTGIFKGIKELKNGEYGFYKNNNIKINRYYRVTAHEHTDNEKETIDKTRFLVIDSIKRQLVSDVPVCCFLSGGLDSSTICAVASEVFKQKGEQLTTFSVDYVDNDKFFKRSSFQPTPDSEFIGVMVDFIGSKHNNIVLDNILLGEALEDAVRARDLPSMSDIDSSMLLFSKEIKKEFSVALSGECADEIFGGYPWYHNESILFEENFPWARSLDVRGNILKKGLLSDGADYVRDRYNSTVNDTDYLPTDSPKEKRMREMFMLNFNWFMQNLLDRKDRMTMYNGLEVRVPFCDYRLVDYAYNMPWKFKAYNNREKGIVRKCLEGILPNDILWRKKSPYPKTHSPSYFKYVKDRVNKIFEDKSSIITELLDYRNIVDMMDNDINVMWYGQLMKTPQVLGYIVQLDYWFRQYNVQIEGL